MNRVKAYVGRVKKLVPEALSNSTPLIATAIFAGLAVAYIPIWNYSEPLPLQQRGSLVLWAFSSFAGSLAILWSLLIVSRIAATHSDNVPRGVSIGIVSMLTVLGTLSLVLRVKFRRWTSLGPDASSQLYSEETIRLIVHAQSLAVALFIAVLSMAVCFVGWDLRRATADQLAKRTADLRILLYTSSALMAILVFQYNRLLAAGLALTKPNEPELPGAQQFVEAASLGAGLIYSALIVAIFTWPNVMAVQAFKLHLQDAIDQSEQEFKKEKWMFSHGFSSTPQSDIATFAAISAPILSSLLTRAIT